MSRRILILAAAVAGALVTTPVAAIEPTTVARVIEPSMVRVIVEAPPDRASASGFVVSAEGHIATAYHIVRPHIEKGWSVFVVESGAAPDARRAAAVVQTFPSEDLAVLKVEGLNRPPAILSESGTDTPPKGMTVFAIGYPGAGERLGADSGTSFTVGMANRIFTGAWTSESARIRIIQHSAATNPGNSGGPIVNPCGQVVGVNTEREIAMLISPMGLPIVYDVIQGVFFASHISVLVEKLKALGVSYNGTGMVCRVILGVASTNFHWYAAAAAVIVLALVAFLIKYWPRRIVHVVILGRLAARNGTRALGRMFYRWPWSLRRGRGVWRLRSEDPEHGPIDIVIAQDELRRARKGLIVGQDPSCDRRVVADGIAEQHARFVPLGDGLGVADLHSETGTAVDERPVDPNDSPAPLAPGAQLRLGNLTFRVERR